MAILSGSLFPCVSDGCLFDSRMYYLEHSLPSARYFALAGLFLKAVLAGWYCNNYQCIKNMGLHGFALALALQTRPRAFHAPWLHMPDSCMHGSSCVDTAVIVKMLVWLVGTMF